MTTEKVTENKIINVQELRAWEHYYETGLADGSLDKNAIRRCKKYIKEYKSGQRV